jgi:periplasmic divalent cation tolerance protein
MKNPILVTTSFEERQQAEKLAAILLQERLIACGQISGPVTSFYWWKGAFTTSVEFILSMKTTAAHYERLEKTIQSNHPYDVPEIVAVPITNLSDDYWAWMQQELQE